MTFESMSRAHIHGLQPDAYTDDDDDEAWYIAMNNRGVNQSLQASIMTPASKSVRSSES